jgi:hypothetical protein
MSLFVTESVAGPTATADDLAGCDRLAATLHAAGRSGE